MPYVHGRDEDEIRAWVEASKTAECAAEYLDKFVYDVKSHAAYMDLVGEERLARLREDAGRR
jgi:hypothetical protein